ncbi:MAG: ribosome small subunit-dependent GTPase A [Treponema sp.]|nr:ribosome small subunit-dependent GTPase A [Treponema sp.]
MRGLVIRGSRNLFTVRPEGSQELLECRIKGKVLKGVEGYYNPLAPGDLVELEGGQIVGYEKRRNLFSRFNQKGQAPQILASNIDLVLCLTSPLSPPFRPRFIDRVLLQADIEDIPAIIVCNKMDLAQDLDPDMEERLSDYERIGYPLFRISAKTGQGMDDLRDRLGGNFSVLVGQSGVGKSSLVKALIPDLEIKIGAISEKFDRGRHTTTQGVLLEPPGAGYRIIDTPGVRRFAPGGVSPEELINYMVEFAPLSGQCSFGLSCSHQVEKGCKIMEAVHAGVIHEDRYESYLRIREELAGTAKYPDLD